MADGTRRIRQHAPPDQDRHDPVCGRPMAEPSEKDIEDPVLADALRVLRPGDHVHEDQRSDEIRAPCPQPHRKEAAHRQAAKVHRAQIQSLDQRHRIPVNQLHSAWAAASWDHVHSQDQERTSRLMAHC
jgi:hypothetical protein